MPCCIRRSSKIRRSPSRTTGSTTVLFTRTHIGRFSAPTLISDAEGAAVPGIPKIVAVHAPLRGVGLTGPDIMMIGVQSVALMIQGLTLEGISPRGGSTGAEPTAMVTIWTVRVEAGPSFLVPSVSVEPSVRLTSLPTSDWRRGLASLQENPSQKRGWMITEWRSRSEEETTTSP